jgi:hypothetical protein
MPNDVRELYEAGREQELTAAADFATPARELQSHESERGTLQAVCELARELLKGRPCGLHGAEARALSHGGKHR